MPELSERDHQIHREVNSAPDVFWRETKSGEKKPASTSLNPEFRALLDVQKPGIYVDIGTGTGRIVPEIPSQHHVIGFDINPDEIEAARARGIENAIFEVASGESLPLDEGSVDGAFLLAVLSTVDKETREKMLSEAARVVKNGGLVYVAEFTRIDDPEARTARDNKLWSDVYRDDELVTGEDGTIIARNADGTPKFHAHHFTKEELIDSFGEHNLEVLRAERVKVKSTVSGADRDNWNIWGRRV